MVWHLATCHVPVYLSQQLRDVLSCVHLTIINARPTVTFGPHGLRG